MADNNIEDPRREVMLTVPNWCFYHFGVLVILGILSFVAYIFRILTSDSVLGINGQSSLETYH